MIVPARLLPCCLFVVLLTLPAPLSAQGTSSDYERANGLRKLTSDKVSMAKLEPHWLGDRDFFWYRKTLPTGAYEFILVDATRGRG